MEHGSNKFVVPILGTLLLVFFGVVLAQEPSQSTGSENKVPQNLISSRESPFATPKDERLASVIADYRAQWFRMTGLNFSGMHWNQSVMVFLNQDPKTYRHNHFEYLRRFQEDLDEELDADELKPYRFYQPGTVLVKENFYTLANEPVTPVSLTIMIKHDPGYDPENGDWEYIQISAAGDTIVADKADNPAVKALCSDCHRNMADRDYLFHTMYNQ